MKRIIPKTHQRPEKVAGVGPVVRLDEPEVVPDVAQVASEDASLMRRFVRERTIRLASLLRVASGEHCCLRSRPELRRVSAAFRSRHRPRTSPGSVSFGPPKRSDSRPRDAFRRSCDLDRGHVGSVSKETLPVSVAVIRFRRTVSAASDTSDDASRIVVPAPKNRGPTLGSERVPNPCARRLMVPGPVSRPKPSQPGVVRVRRCALPVDSL